ncbi:MAG: roadblock/LC7 domain-containing protein [Candidatus Thermoplasmatota archaeon]|nr:roadblock/LC7 domain-containing protein [Candidatus Sysuiplasma jiujiangense]MBX8639110.1 roadblock/LC7 domain-containing protein [Candidatus Sysuiplasma jiujiangense]MBX8641443.1 roadblock/LC7 domain-containing protein [Candidatus Sysuiplasma jiujiangense]MCL4317890.1 roadblock/LC7 domain-containing protein [Candidatus Thermoplasmatota archaeon]MCL5254318.1 roadblock/LC7 domain-containing protein [Candidatus Thermoplasmatota archaeon]
MSAGVGQSMAEGKIANRKTEERALDRIVADAQLSSCSIVSKTGLLVAVDTESTQKKETFAAMSAIVFSAAEALKSDVKDGGVTNIVATFQSSRIVFVPINQNYILVGVTKQPEWEGRSLKALEEGAAKLRKEAPWLN